MRYGLKHDKCDGMEISSIRSKQASKGVDG